MSEINVTAVITPKPENFAEVSSARPFYILADQTSHTRYITGGGTRIRSHQTG